MISRLKQNFYNPGCFRCGSFFVEEHLFCETCFDNHIAPRIEIKRRTILLKNRTFEHFYLFDWNPGESDLISKLVYQLKGSRCVPALSTYAAILAAQIFAAKEINSAFSLIVPLPGSKKSSVHANIIAERISTRLKIKSSNLLTKDLTSDSQKTRNLQERKDLQLRFGAAVSLEQITSLEKNKPNVIYVDDILTTGSTFHAGREAMGFAHKACIMTIFYRPALGART